MSHFRTDLAEESHLRHRATQGFDHPGADLRRYHQGPFSVSDLRITTEEAARALEKPRGRYLTATGSSPGLQDSLQCANGKPAVSCIKSLASI